MQLTPEQQDQLRQAKASNSKRVSLKFTTQQKDSWQKAVESELAGKDENIAHLRKMMAAAEQPGFFGDVRRAALMSRRSMSELAAEIGVDPELFSDFRAGDAELPAAALDRLIVALGLRLMQEIPR
jgi:hypothetical protein